MAHRVNVNSGSLSASLSRLHHLGAFGDSSDEEREQRKRKKQEEEEEWERNPEVIARRLERQRLSDLWERNYGMDSMDFFTESVWSACNMSRICIGIVNGTKVHSRLLMGNVGR
jgi:hypothetical protein